MEEVALAVVVGQDNELLIAKFPSPKDEWNVELWEAVALKLARKAGIPVPDFWLQNISGQHVLLLKRFDRGGENIRIPYLSAMSMLSANDGDRRSYLDIAEALNEHGAETKKDLEDLWRRLVFNILVSNLDDHLRNHGFLYDQKLMGWRLSPIYDLEPLPEHVKGRFLQTCIDVENNRASLDLAFEVAEEFDLTSAEARKTAKEVGESTKSWRREAEQAGAGKKEIDFMSSAFEHENLKKAL
jgi:serine/threonine-protein kinase HipA